MCAPLRLDGLVSRSMSPCISPDGRLFVPTGCTGGLGLGVQVFNDVGSPMTRIPVDDVGPTGDALWTAYAHGDSTRTPLLVVGDEKHFLAFDPYTRAVRWALGPTDVPDCGGIAVFPSQGVIAVRSNRRNTLCVHRLSDGVRIGGYDFHLPDQLCRFLAADPATATLYARCRIGAEIGVYRWSCAADGSLRSQGPVATAGLATYTRPLVIVPPAPGKILSHLVVCADDTELRVLTLPDFAVVHTHRLEGMGVRGLAADPWGGALAVCDEESEAIHVIAWPLPGMPPLG